MDGLVKLQSIFVMHELIDLYFLFTKIKPKYFIAKILSIDMFLPVSMPYSNMCMMWGWISELIGRNGKKKYKNKKTTTKTAFYDGQINSDYNFWAILGFFCLYIITTLKLRVGYKNERFFGWKTATLYFDR